jgi:hypothetical protein
VVPQIFLVHGNPRRLLALQQAGTQPKQLRPKIVLGKWFVEPKLVGIGTGALARPSEIEYRCHAEKILAER